MDYSYWIELSSGSRLPVDAVKRIHDDEEFWGASHRRFLTAAAVLAAGRDVSAAHLRRWEL
jgi:hypothetical protein